MTKKNILILQSGGVTSVINRSLFGIIQEAQKRFTGSRIYASKHGIQGIITGNMPDITDISEEQMYSLRNTPGAALGSSRHKLKKIELEIFMLIILGTTLVFGLMKNLIKMKKDL